MKKFVNFCLGGSFGFSGFFFYKVPLHSGFFSPPHICGLKCILIFKCNSQWYVFTIHSELFYWNVLGTVAHSLLCFVFVLDSFRLVRNVHSVKKAVVNLDLKGAIISVYYHAIQIHVPHVSRVWGYVVIVKWWCYTKSAGKIIYTLDCLFLCHQESSRSRPFLPTLPYWSIRIRVPCVSRVWGFVVIGKWWCYTEYR